MDKEQVLLSQMLESWKDIRGYGSLVWQITGLCLAATGIVIGQAIGGTYDGNPILSTYVGVMLLFFIVLISLIAISAINWLFRNVITRADMIHQMEARFHDFDFELYSPQLEKIPSKGTYGFGLLFVYEWKDLPLLVGILFEAVAGVAIIGIQTVLYQLSPTQMGDDFVTILTGLLLVGLAYSLYGSIKLRNRYVEALKTKEFKRIRKKYEDIEK